MIKRKSLLTLAKVFTLAAVGIFAAGKAGATPYASGLTNNSGTIQFYLNETNATVLVTYEDGTTNSVLNGVTSINMPTGQTNFLLGAHTSYQIKVTKNGTGAASLLTTHSVANSRGVDVNHVVNSPNFGQVYICVSTLANISGSLRRLNSDMTLINTNSGGVAWVASSGSSPYRLAVNDDNWLTVGDFASAHSGVWRVSPDLTTNQLMLGPISDTAGSAFNSHGSEFSRPLLIGNLSTGGNAVLYTVDAGNFPFNASQLNSILVYSNINLTTMPRTNAPDLLGPETGLNLPNLNNNYPGLTVGPNGYFYASNRRDTAGKANVQVYDQNYNLLWDSVTATGNGSDYFIIGGLGLGDGAVSPDGKFFGGVGITDNHITVVSLTNGIPDISTLYTIVNSNTTSQVRGFCWDAADNAYVSSSGVTGVQEWSLGLSATAITSGNAAGQTNFSLTSPASKISVTATTPFASQAGPTPGVFTITRSSVNPSDIASSLTVFYSLTGTATNGTYTISGGTTGSVTFAAGQTSTNITITPVNDGLSRPTTTLSLTISGNGNYSGVAPVSATISIQNVGPQYVFISTATSSFYKGVTNDYPLLVLTRWGDTNAASYTVSSFTYAGTAAAGVQFTLAQPITFNPGDVIVTNTSIFPLIDTTNYVGNKTVIVSLSSGAGYTAGTNKLTATLMDNAYLPATVLWANPLTDPADAVNWNVTSANGNMQTNGIDNTIEFGYDLTANNGESANNGLISLPPSGATTCLRVTVNKNTGVASAVNLYPTNVTFSGDYAFRFAMNVTEGNNAVNTTEGPMFGINHGGTYTNWWIGSAIQSGWAVVNGTNQIETWSSDGIWYTIIADADASAGDYIEKTGAGGTNGNSGWTTIATASHTSFGNAFKNPTPYSTTLNGLPVPGLPVNATPFNPTILGTPYTNAWANVEVKTVNKKVTMSINGTAIFTYTNTTVWTNGTVMLGYFDPFNSVGGLDGAVYFSDAKVVRLAGPVITKQPTNIVAAIGTVTNFSVAVSFDSSSANTNGQWTFNGTNLVGQTNTTLNLTVSAGNYGTYAYTVNDGNYSVTSSNAVLSAPIPPAPVIISVLPATRAAAPGSSPTFTVVATTSTGITNYQWLSNSVPLAGSVTNVLTLTNIQLAGFGSFYKVKVGDGTSFTTSASPVTVTLAVPQTITAPGFAAVGKFALTLNTEFGPSYVVDSKTNLLQPTWIPLSTNAGTGSPISITNAVSTVNGNAGFFRIRLQ